MRRRPAARRRCFLLLPPVLATGALLHPPTRARTWPSAAFRAFRGDVGRTRRDDAAPRPAGGDGIINGERGDILRTLELKDEALMQAEAAVSSLESALESAVSNLEDVQRELQLRAARLERELETTRRELSDARSDLGSTKKELRKTRKDLVRSREESDRLRSALAESREAASRADELGKYVATLKEVKSAATPTPAPEKDSSLGQWKLFSSGRKAAPVLADWIAIKGAGEGEVQISGKVAGHPSIPDGDAIVTSSLMDPGRAAEGRVVATSSGSRYRLGAPMAMPSGESASRKVASSSKKEGGLVKARSSISIPDLTGNTLGNGRYLLAGDATSSINGRSWIQTAYRASPFGKPTGEPLAIKFSPNKEAMKREFNNYQKVSSGLKRGSFIRRVEFLPVAGREMPDKSALVMQRGVADVKAFMPKVGGNLGRELLADCALTALRCVEALHAARLVWNDLKTENFVVIEDARGGVSFRGIDLESCMPVRTAPIDYTPEACPPEFARSFLDGDAESFSLEYSYDVWSYGMFLYEICTGRGFFDGCSAEKITKSLPNFQPSVDKVEDPALADLILSCLSQNPKDRPSVVRIFKHPFFADAPSPKTPFDFLFGI